MSDSYRPPLDHHVYDLIELSLHSADQRHWDQLEAMQVAPVIGLPKSLPSPKLRGLLLNRLEVYAGELFKLEADNYTEYRNREEYPSWLSKLGDRVIERVFNRIAILERANEPATLAHHGLTDDEIRAGLSGMLREVANTYVWKDADPQVRAGAPSIQPATIVEAPAPDAESPPKPTQREELRDSYRANFPDAGIMDICWAAKQHYREWTRWLKNEVKDGSKPDRSFLHVLLSEKDAKTLRREIRPKNWK